MYKCSHCGGKLGRVHRRFRERFGYLAIFECKDCGNEESVPRRYMFHFGPNARCPRCGTFRIVKLKSPDKIDPMYTGVLNFIERLMGGGRLYHCRYCRCQFYDRRATAAENAAAAEKAEMEIKATPPPDTVRSDA
jgi:DNA-directed RNA polymerase subunit RPC12/RpoP